MKRPQELRENQWQLAPTLPTNLRQQLDHIHPVLLQILYNRGISDERQIQAFLEGHYLASTDPFLLPDMDKAVVRIQQAVEQKETIVVYGDFDADGVTSTVLLTEALRGLGVDRRQAQPYIPDRVDEGYGLNFDALTKIREEIGASLCITVDCGIRSINEVQHAMDIGLDMIITDHHSLGATLPPAVAIINPKRPSDYPETMLAGVGIAFKLAQALRLTMPDRASYQDEDFLDLVAIGTVADLAPLLGENRQLVMRGLDSLNQARRPGVRALAQVSGVTPGSITAESIGFGLGPRINAAGRLAHAYDAAKLLAVNNDLTARRLAHDLNELNKQRRQITADLGQKAEAMVDPNAPIIIAADDSFLSGVVGLVASRLAEKNYRPAIIVEKGETESRGSCRSIPEFHITEALDELAGLLERHGGHAQAAGFTVRNENLDQFTQQMIAIAESRLAGQALRPTLTVDVEIYLHDIDWALYESLRALEPTGYANPSPVFMSRFVEVVSHRTVGQDGAHLQLRLMDGKQRDRSPQVFAAIAFRQGAWATMLPRYIDLVYALSVNEWRGQRTLQLVVQDIRPAEMPLFS